MLKKNLTMELINNHWCQLKPKSASTLAQASTGQYGVKTPV